ncbi:MAG TPA: molybdate ABC transporter substrate-binding protein [Herpetosiphon sp.]|uniref:Molybdate-binding protein ModA n=1 Tax=Herpetosiphon aurantiacus (strain ATCC 23779 / DSM 785 / 114-95) TaxID=316274 RepID=A9B2T8_HERA2|nr:molybdate ABC transporter substrate-binding protein [Herpetosiphon sp.]ABX05539.1 molybdenum ABC transporter, periplasmic molybdate-binding protein [Herpetosiphon aurantiacus DSM 785]HBW52085.1 molybdate ABC transporter substrate-binding protein [Herpetosiphon sp.]
MKQIRRIGLFVLSLSLLACGAATTSVPTTPAAPTTSTNPTPTLSGEINVFAAASLTGAFTEIGNTFQTSHPNTKINFNFAGSDQLATQITQGAPADVFASANSTQMQVAVDAGMIDGSMLQPFARNRLIVVYPQSNPAQIQSLQDLAKPKLKLVLASASVPVGNYALDFLAKASALPEFGTSYSPTVLLNVVSYENNVKAVLSKVSLGEADAGIVYSTDAASISDSSIGTLAIPDQLNTIATYPIAITQNSANSQLAQAFVDFVLTPAGQQILARYGFITVTDPSALSPYQLLIAGNLTTPLTLTAELIENYEQQQVEFNGQSYRGLGFGQLLMQIQPKSNARTFSLLSSDGSQTVLAIADLTADPRAIIAAEADGSFTSIIPSNPNASQLKNIVKITVE